VVSGGKQYRVAPGDRLLVDRLRAEPGVELALERVVFLAEGDDIKVGEALSGIGVLARIVDHRRGPKVRVLRYKSKKRVRVHRGARADLTLIEIVEVAGHRAAEPEKPAGKPKPAGRLRGLRRRRTGAAAEATPAEPEAAETAAIETPSAPARRRRSSPKPPAAEETGDGA
jgi:large subunit ribosomal protein L21